ncbi:MAG: S41 family peptidase [Bacteroidales bacterium]|jgi:carboxyl-terminal processing protease|nr:S41 family peptidase [Bacteroidales bacterium]
MHSTFNKILFYILIFLFSLFLVLFGVSYIIDHKIEKMVTQRSSKLEEVLYYIQKNYVDTVNSEQLMERAISSMLETLDPHSTYSTAEQNKVQQENLDGAFEGVGIQFNIMNDTVMVINATSGGPSEKAGIRAGDRIVTVDKEKVAAVGITNDKVFKKLRGKKGTQVELGIVRPGITSTLQYKITRDVIETFSIDISYMIDKQTGYIKINQFGGTTFQEFTKALHTLKRSGMQSLIVDLQGNAGGYLDAAINICDHFLKKGEMILYTEGLNKKTEKVYATSKGDFENGSLIILIDEFSASASEIVAGAVQDNDRGTVIGRRSFGKGLVQQMIPLSDGSSLRLTVARYHTPSGRCIQREYSEGVEAYYEAFVKRFQEGEINKIDSSQFNSKLKYQTKKGRTVYGGGGIFPDIYVPLEQNKVSESYKNLINSSLIVEFCFNYSNENKLKIKTQYQDANRFVEQFEITDIIINQYFTFFKKRSSQPISNLNHMEKKQLKSWLKALIGRNIFQENGFYPILNQDDPVVQKALQTLRRSNK